MTCQYCKKECKSPYSKRAHEILCQLNPSRKEHPRGATGKKPWNKGLTETTDPRIKSSTDKMRKFWESNVGSFTGKQHTKETKQKMSRSMKEAYKNGTRDVYCGRAKKYVYESPFAGKVTLDGTWELIVAKWLDKQNIPWQRNKKRFTYIHLNGKTSTYLPDFYLTVNNEYWEVKGYETKLDHCKWSQFTETLVVIRKERVNEMRQNLENA